MSNHRKALSISAFLLAAALTFSGCGAGSSDPAPAASDAPDAPAPAVSSAPAGAGDTAPAGDPIRHGLVTPHSGAHAGHGAYGQGGAELWKEDVNARGGILGRPVELVYEDNGETEQTYMNAMVKALSDDDLCAVYSNGYSNQITLVLPEVANYEIPLLAGNSSQACLDANNDYYWMLRLSDANVSPAMVLACRDQLNMKKPAILNVNDSYGRGMADFVVKAIEENGMELAIQVECTAEEKQFTPILTQIVNSGADGIIAINHQDQAALVMMQIEAMDIQLPLMGCSQYASALAMDTAGEASNGWYSLADWSNEVQTESGKAFVEAYRKAYNRDSDMQSVCAYDAMLLLEDAITRAGTDDPKAVNEALKQTKDVVGAMTSYTYLEGDHSLGTSIMLTQTQDKKGVMIDMVAKPGL